MCLLFFLEKPSKPKCWLEGELLEGKELSLQCRSASGTAPISYRWQRINEEDERAEHLPPTSRVSKSGHFSELLIRSKPDNRPHACVESLPAAEVGVAWGTDSSSTQRLLLLQLDPAALRPEQGSA